MITYQSFGVERMEEVKALYQKEGWHAYLKDDQKLLEAFLHSLMVLGAFHDNHLVGFIRMVGDGAHIVLVQDLIVAKNYQHQGIGKHLFTAMLDQYKDVRMFQVITDKDDIVDNHFYQSFGLHQIIDGNMVAYFRK